LLRNANRELLRTSTPTYAPLNESAIRRIADAALEVLAKSGMAVYSPTAFEALCTAGAQVDAESHIVSFPRSLVEDAIDSNPSSITLFSCNGEHDVVLERDRVHYSTGGTAIYVLDPDTDQRRPSTVEDVILNARMIAGSAEALREKPFVSFITLIISPFKIDKDYGEMTCYLAKEGLPVVVPTEPICGTTSPITLAGSVLTHIAETLGGIALVQCINRGAPGICGSVGSITNLETMDHLGGPIERAMINAAVAQMAQHFEIPLYSTGGTTDSKEVDIQAAYESAMSSLLVAMSGANYIHDIAGLMESDLTVSYEKLAMDNEILGMCQRVLRGIEVTDETLATELMIEKGPGKDFMMEEHTLRHMRKEFFVPELANRQKRGSMSPGDNALVRAKVLVKEISSSPRVSRLPADLRERILQSFPEIRLPRDTAGVRSQEKEECRG